MAPGGDAIPWENASFLIEFQDITIHSVSLETLFDRSSPSRDPLHALAAAHAGVGIRPEATGEHHCLFLSNMYFPPERSMAVQVEASTPDSALRRRVPFPAGSQCSNDYLNDGGSLG